MGTIYGSNGDIWRKSGNTSYKSGPNGSEQIRHYGDTAYCSDGRRLDKENVSYLGNNNLIRKQGDTYYAGTKVYRLQGNVLYGPFGKTWRGIETDTDVRDVISHDI